MAKQKKKRNKIYRGPDASLSRPVITKITAANRNRVSQWWFEKKRVVRPALIAAGVVVLIILIVIGIINLF